MKAANDNDWIEGEWSAMHRIPPGTRPIAYTAGYNLKQASPTIVEYARKKRSKWGKVLPFKR